jgi:hypothetical protein
VGESLLLTAPQGGSAALSMRNTAVS